MKHTLYYLKAIKDRCYYLVAVKNDKIEKDYRTYKESHKQAHQKAPWRSWKTLLRLNYRYRILHKDGYLFFTPPEKEALSRIFYYQFPEKRLPVERLLEQLASYDVVSFDIFDTAIFRKVDRPERIFYIMGMEMGFHDFMSVRKKAEMQVRDKKERETGSREIVLSEIYDVLGKQAGIDKQWMQREIDLELRASCVNPYIHAIYKGLLRQGKTILFTSDMYLPKAVIEQLLHNAGYTEYNKLYLSNEYGVNKGNGNLQRAVKSDYPDCKIVHIGDNMHSDVNMTKSVGIDAIFNRDTTAYLQEENLDNLAGSTYTAVINNTMNSGMWQNSLHYDHGYRIGGILLTGFCQYINRVARERKVEKILFCARDCEIVHRAYNLYFHEFENAYLEISRYAILNLCSERYAYDMIGRCIMRYMNEFRTSKTIGTILEECGYSYLIPYLEESNLDQFMFPQAIAQKKIEEFILDHLYVIQENNTTATEAAKSYYASVIGTANNILVVDLGWSGSCITDFKYFMETRFPERQLQISGVLACTSRNWTVASSVEDNVISAYLYSPMKNMDITKTLMPGGEISRNRDEMDRRHLPMESLFTSKEASLLSYDFNSEGQVRMIRRPMMQPNEEEIDAIQMGMLDFTKTYLDYCNAFEREVYVPPYVAFTPFGNMLNYSLYCYAVYHNFVYDTPMAPYDTSKNLVTMSALYPANVAQAYENKRGELLPEQKSEKLSTRVKRMDSKFIQPTMGRILFVSPELPQTGAPRSLLRMCRVAKDLGYHAELWSAKDGPFRMEYEKLGIPVNIVPENRLKEDSIRKAISSFDMAVCNTIVTDAYERVCSTLIPTVWYIREATNIPDFITGNWMREYTLKNSRNICCVSEYAAEAIQKFTAQEVRVFPNCVEDEVEMATDYVAGSGDKIKFVQFGTMEYRKGYDVLLAAYQAMPETYKEKAELYFAGGFINSGTPYCSYLFARMKDEPNVHYLGVVRGEANKIQTLSKMDVVVVASRDESCSLVALEGAMLSKPLIVTENVGAKYIVKEANGFVVKTGDVESLMRAMMALIDGKNKLAQMGVSSREMYEKHANMDAYTKNMAKLYAPAQKQEDETVEKQIEHSKRVYSETAIKKAQVLEEIAKKKSIRTKEEVIVSMTSHPGRINMILPCVQSLLSQSSRPEKLLLWLAKPQFPNLKEDLPKELVKLAQNNKYFEIRWTDDDLGPHKKYYYVMQEYPELPVITVDDDVIYDKMLVSRLMNSYRQYPHCISSMRTNMIMFDSNGSFQSYYGWVLDYSVLKDTPSAQLLPTGVGGVLYPPHAVPEFAFNKEAIQETCLYADDLWLKVSTLHNGYKTVLVKDYTTFEQIPGTNETALWRMNVTRNNNDVALSRIMDYYDKNIGNAKELRENMWRDRAV